MKSGNLTDRFVESLRPHDGRRVELRDGKVRGLIIRVSENGSKAWSVLYRRQIDGRRRRHTIGAYPQVSLAEARAQAMAVLARVARGEDPSSDRRRIAGGRPRTFGDLAERYLARHAKVSKRSGFQDRQMLHKDVLPVLGSEPLEAIKRADIGEIVHRIVERGSPIQANRTFEVIRGLYNWALGAGLVETTPVLGLKAPTKECSRERALSSEEVWRFWHGLPSAPMSWSAAQILRLCLATAQRVSEVAGVRRSEIDLAAREWRLPGARVKNQCAHVVPLCSLAMTLFEEALARSPDDDVVFPSPITKQAICGSSLAKAMKRSSQALQLDDATPHDLRRTAATGMAKCGVSRLVIDKILNHVSADRSTIAGIYDRYGYEREKRAGLQAWESHLLAIVENSELPRNVLDLRAVV